MWNKSGFILHSHNYDEDFCRTHIESAKHFLCMEILPGVVGKFYTRKVVANTDSLVPNPTPSSLNCASTNEGDKDNDDEDPLKL